MIRVLLSDRYESLRARGGYQNVTMEEVTHLRWPEHEAVCLQLSEREFYQNSDMDIEVSYFKSSNRYFLVTFFRDTIPPEDGLSFVSAPSAAILVLDENFEVVHGLFL
ncbi:MAG: hypothetical protein LAT67_11565 [Balneolales bacterium]|nr:hypothetical protein [Balneolales bacterium]